MILQRKWWRKWEYPSRPYEDLKTGKGLILVSAWSEGKDYRIKPAGIGWLLDHRALQE